MAIIRFENGTEVNFDGSPTQQDVEEVAQKLNLGAASTTPQQKEGNFLSYIGNFGVGAGKGALSTLQGASTLGQKILGKGAALLVSQSREITKIPERFTTPEGTAQKLGFGAEQIGEFAVPFTKIGKVEKGLGLAEKGLKALTGRATLEAGVGGGITALQTGGDIKSTQDSAIISAAFPFLGKSAQIAKGFLPEGKAIGARVINSLIKPLSKEFSYGKNPGRAVAEEGITGRTLDELTNNITTRKNEIGSKIGDIIKSIKGKIDLSNLVLPINEALTTAKKTPSTNAALISRLEGAKSDLLLAGGGYKKISKLDPQAAFDLKQIVSGVTKFTGSPSDDKAVNLALKRVYGNIKEKIVNVAKSSGKPEIEKLSEKYADLSSAEIAAVNRDKIIQRQNLISIVPKFTALGGVAGLVGGIFSGNPALIGTGLAAIGEAGIQSAFASPRVKTAFAKWLAKSNAQEIQKVSKISPFLKGIILKEFQ